MLHDLRFAIRILLKSPGFTAVALLTLALGIGSNTAIFSVINHVLLNSLPYRDADRLVSIYLHDPEHGFPKDIMSYPRFLDTKNLTDTLSGTSAYTSATVALSGVDEPEQLSAVQATAGFFHVLGISPRIGRGFAPGEDEEGKDQVVVLGQGLWARRYGADPNVLGRKIILNSQPYTVIGVMPASFEFPDKTTELWMPLAPNRDQRASRGSLWLNVIARLKDGVSIPQAKTQLDALNKRLGEKFPQSDLRNSTLVLSLRDDATEDVRLPLLVVTCAVGCVLLIACANVASMMLARAAGRNREIAIRMAIGANRGRVIRQLVTESLVLYVIGGVAGLALSVWGVAMLIRLAPASMPELKNVSVNLPVALFALGMSVLTGVIFGLIPALTAMSAHAGDSLKQRGGSGRANQAFRHGMVVAQISLAILLLGASGLLIRSFNKLGEVKLGFRSDHLLTFAVSLPQSRYAKPEQRSAFFDTLTERLRAIPGVESAGATTSLLLGELPNASGSFTIEGRAQDNGEVKVPLALTNVTGGFFSAFGEPLLEGREFNQFDRRESTQVAIINESMAKRYWSGVSPIGHRFVPGGNPDGRWLTIVGVVADTRRRGLDRDVWLEAYFPSTQQSRRGMRYIVRTTGDPLAMAPLVRQQVLQIDRDQPISAVAVMDQLLDDRIAPRRFVMLLLALLAGTALILAAVGLYGVLAYLVTLRTQEIGVRLALGATSSDVLALISKRSLMIVGSGILVGLVASLAATRWLSSLLYGVSPRDPIVLTAAAFTIFVAAVVASYVPVRRASKVDPIIALRYE